MDEAKFIDVHSYDGKLKMILKESFTDDEKKVYLIAKEHLGSSFDLEKSIGFIRRRRRRVGKVSPSDLFIRLSVFHKVPTLIFMISQEVHPQTLHKY